MTDDQGDSQPDLVLGTDYYVEDGRWIFTAHYLRARGHCCQNGCRHCPYKPAEKPDQNKVES